MNITRVSGAATASTTAQFELQRRHPVIKVRRYGRNDFEKFDEETARGSRLCVGSATIGKVDIDCKYHWKKAQWGVLSKDEVPAGIIYMDITFRQPRGYWLKQAHVYVTLSEDMCSYALGGSRYDRERRWRPLSSDYAVQITEHYGPQYLTSTKTVLTKTKENTLVPTVGVMGFEFGGIGHKTGSSKEHIGQWVFRGTVRRPQHRDGFQTLEWELSENSLNPEQAHNQTYHTAFAFEHSKRPVFMRVEVEGKLRDRRRQMKQSLLRFSSAFGRKDNSTLTEIGLDRHINFRKPLDQIARGLDMDMQRENWEKIPVEMPDQMPVQFTRESTTQNSPDEAQVVVPRNPPINQESGTSEDLEAEERLELQEHEYGFLEYRSPDPILDSLRRQLRSRAVINNGIGSQNPTVEVRDQGFGVTGDGNATAADSEPASAEQATKSSEVIDESLLEILKFPALLVLLRFIVTVLQRFSKAQQGTLQIPPKVVPGSHGRELLTEEARLLESNKAREGDWPKEIKRNTINGIFSQPPARKPDKPHVSRYGVSEEPMYAS